MIHIMLLNLFRTERLLFYQDVYFIKKNLIILQKCGRSKKIYYKSS